MAHDPLRKRRRAARGNRPDGPPPDADGRSGPDRHPSRTAGFTGDTAVQALSEGTYITEIKPGWDIGANANGGYLLSIAVSAMIDAARLSDPVTVTAHFLRPGRPAAASVNTEVAKRAAGSRRRPARALAADGNRRDGCALARGMPTLARR